MSQTTFAENAAHDIVAALSRANPRAEVRFQNTVCEPTRQRRAAIAKLLPQVDKVVVVGGHNSNNTRQLVHACQAGGGDVVQVQGPEDLDPRWFEGCATVGLTAGTSTLDRVVDAVGRVLEGFGQVAAPVDPPMEQVVPPVE